MPTTVTQSTYIAGSLQQDGVSYYVDEHHLLSDGRTVSYSYMNNGSLDPETVMQARAQRVEAEIQTREASLAAASQGAVPWTKFQFRQRFTASEQQAVDEFNSTFESSPGLTAEQKRQIRTGLKNLESSGAVYADNPATIAGVQMYESLGLIAPGRAAEILGGA